MSGELILSRATKNLEMFYLTRWLCECSKSKVIPLNSWCKQLIDFDSKIKTEIFWARSLYNRNTFIKWQLEILPMNKITAYHYLYIGFQKYYLSQLSAISAISSQPIVYPKVIAFSTILQFKNRKRQNMNYYFYVKF